MEVNFSNSFFESLKTIRRHETWYYKTWENVTVKFPYFLKNIWRFRKALWDHRWWDWRFHFDFLHTSLSIMEKGMHGGIEVRESRDKKIEKMQRALYLMECFREENFIEIAEMELGEIIDNGTEFEECEESENFKLKDNLSGEEEAHNSRVYKRAREIEKEYWGELWEIFRGQDYSKFDQKKDFNEQFDGTGMRGWWD